MRQTFLTILTCLAALQSYAADFKVTVPSGTRSCYVAGAFNGWDADAPLALTRSGDTSFTGSFPDLSDADVAQGYKYLCGPGWSYVEKDASGNEIANRTVPSNPDVVGSWAATFNPDIRQVTLKVNGYDRNVRIWAPADCRTSGKTYPVVYYTGVQQRYSSAGSDDAGDDFFAENSWNAATVAESLSSSGKECILVCMYSFVAENMPWSHPDYAGSGATDDFLTDYIDVVKKYVDANYPVADAPSTTIMGADMGAIQAMYAAVSHPDLFGRCVAVSPVSWLFPEETESLAHEAAASGVKFMLAYGNAETGSVKNAVDNLANILDNNATLCVIEGGTHDDTSWSSLLPTIYSFASDDATITGNRISVRANVARKNTAKRTLSLPIDLAAIDFRLYSGLNTTTLTADSNTAFALIDDYQSKGGTTKRVKSAVRVVDASFKSTFYWNIRYLDNDTWTNLLDADKSTKFSSKKTNASWLRMVINEDGSVESNSASSKGFTLHPGEGDAIKMAVNEGFTVEAEVPFTGTDKSFCIHYGSVNSESDMGALTETYTVSKDCVKASVTYDYLTNKVSVTETAWGQTIGDVTIENFSAVPARTLPGGTTDISVALNNDARCIPSLTVAHNYGSKTPLDVTLKDGVWNASLSDLKEGIYHISMSLNNGSTTKEDVAVIAVKVTPAESTSPTKTILSVNAYDAIDWSLTNRFKANFHTHTSQSFDTKFATHEVVDLYHQAGYSILALTDHDANPYPWEQFDLYNPAAESRSPSTLGMLAIPGVELSKDNRNTWDEKTGGSFNHHNDFFTGRKGQEFASLRESYAYTDAIGGLQIINHPGQYWNLANSYTPGEKNSPQWHAENFNLYPSLIGLEVYNQGNRRPNDRILWDQILSITMPERPVWGYSNDDTHTREQYFRNYQFMLMPALDAESLKTAMRGGHHYFSYEYTGSGEDKAPHISSINHDVDASTITIDTPDADEIQWISSTDIPSGAAPSARKSTVIGYGKSFCYTGFLGSYVRALLKNEYGETCTQPFGFVRENLATSVTPIAEDSSVTLEIYPNPATDFVTFTSSADIEAVTLVNLDGAVVKRASGSGPSMQLDVASLSAGTYLAVVSAGGRAETKKLIIK